MKYKYDYVYSIKQKAIYKDGPSLLNIGQEQIEVSESNAAEKQAASSGGPKRIEFSFAFSNHRGSNYTITQTADTIEYEWN